mmetsp:Transcript_71853/g.126589  ORF Transcript_71853/g.126589 Transcript_71853/m.126589 type:complete len:114 (-) Transcript_71853:522-863(-)
MLEPGQSSSKSSKLGAHPFVSHWDPLLLSQMPLESSHFVKPKHPPEIVRAETPPNAKGMNLSARLLRRHPRRQPTLGQFSPSLGACSNLAACCTQLQQGAHHGSLAGSLTPIY